MKLKQILFIIYGVILLGLLAFLGILSNERGGRDLALTEFGNDWRTEDGEYVSLENIPTTEQSVTLEKILPESISEKDQLNIISHNIYFYITVDGKEVYSYYPGENITGWGYGDQVHYIPIPYDGVVMELTCEPIYHSDGSGMFQDAYIGSQEAFVKKEFNERGISFVLAVLTVFLGLFIFVLYVGSFGMQATIYNLPALGIVVLMAGSWIAIKSLIPQLLMDNPGLLRVIDYSILALIGYPLVVFINSAVSKPRKYYEAISFGITMFCTFTMLGLRVLLGIDMHSLNFFNVISVASSVVMVVMMIAQDVVKTVKGGTIRNSIVFYIGVALFIVGIAMDLGVYYIANKTTKGSGLFMQIGLVCFIGLMVVQTIRAMLREHRSFDQQKFVNDFLQYSLSGESPDEIIDQMLHYMGEELGADRAYIFEERDDGTFDNTYEWCRAGVTPEMENLQGVPYAGALEVWYDEYDKSNCVIIEDIEEYKEVSETLYDILKPQDIHSLVTGPLEFEGKRFGFFGVDNPPSDRMKVVPRFIKLIEYFMSATVRQRDNHEMLYRFSFVDSLTGVMNRRSLDEMIEDRAESENQYGLLMCDINGLKRANDEQGHLVGDMMIQDVADVMAGIFGKTNVYRLGGDEFLAVTFDKSRSELEKCLKQVRTRVRTKGHSVSLGMAYQTDGSRSFGELLKTADENMYEDKEIYYKMHGDRRRK